MARGNYIYPPEPTMRLTTDIFEYCQRERAEVEHDLDLRLPHPREGLLGGPGGRLHALQRDRLRRGGARPRASKIDEFAPRLAFFFNGHNNVFQEIAKFRAVRRMWAKIVARAVRGREPERSQKIRFHTQTGGVTLQAQQPEVNIIRVALQGFAAVCGGTQSLHTNGFDEALALPTERSARIALRTQQVLAHESGAADTVDPFAGSYFVESLTDEIETRAWELMEKVEELGGSVEALEFMQREIEESALSYHERYKTGQDIIVGVNKYVTDTGRRRRHPQGRPGVRAAPAGAAARLQGATATRPRVEAKLEALRDVARGEGNLLLPDPRGARRRRLDRRGLRRDARRLRRVQGRRLLLGLVGRRSSLVARVRDEIVVAGWDRAEGERGWRQNHALMESKAKRTLVKSAPELWELADDPARMQSWMSGLVGGGPVLVEVTDRDPERVLAWRSAQPGADGSIAIELAESGFGTAVADHRPALARRSGQGDRRTGGAAR